MWVLVLVGGSFVIKTSGFLVVGLYPSLPSSCLSQINTPTSNRLLEASVLQNHRKLI